MSSLPFAVGNPTRTTIARPASGRPVKDTLSAALERARDFNAGIPRNSRTTPPPATCPSCGYDMTVINVTPTFRRDDCEDVSYKCEKCGTQMHRQIRSKPAWASRDPAAAGAGQRART